MVTNKKKLKINLDVFLGIALMIFSVIFLRESYKLHEMAAQFPKIVLTTLLIFSTLLTILGIWKTIYPSWMLKSDTLLNMRVIKSPLTVFLIVVVYVILLKEIGFFIATIVFIPALMVYYGVRKIHIIMITDILINLFVYVLFVKILHVILP